MNPCFIFCSSRSTMKSNHWRVIRSASIRFSFSAGPRSCWGTSRQIRVQLLPTRADHRFHCSSKSQKIVRHDDDEICSCGFCSIMGRCNTSLSGFNRFDLSWDGLVGIKAANRDVHDWKLQKLFLTSPLYAHAGCSNAALRCIGEDGTQVDW